MKVSDIIQWNCRGIRNKRQELQILAQQCKAQALCLQETKLSPMEEYQFPGYCVFTKSQVVGLQGNAHGGVAILARNNVSPIPIRLNTRLQAVAISLKLQRRITICSLYTPPGKSGDFTAVELEGLLDQLPKPYMVLGDINAHNTLWFDKNTDGRGKTVEKVLTEKSLYFLDKDKDTHIYTINQGPASSHIDLSICSLDLILEFEWGCWGDLMGSDHFPIWLRSGRKSRPLRYPKWVIEKANWEKFRGGAVPRMGVDDFDSIDELGDYTKNFIVGAASDAIPKTSGRGRDYVAPWWNEECHKARIERENAGEKFRQGEGTRAYWQQKAAEAKRTFRRNKRRSWREFIEGINGRVSVKEVWRKIGLLTNKYKSKEVSALKVGGLIIDDKKEIANRIAQKMEAVSSEAACSEEFLRHKTRSERRNIDFSSDHSFDYNLPITRQELDAALHELRDSAPGPDDVHNLMLKNLPEEAKVFLLEFLNKVFLEGLFPEEWRLAHVIPILKEGKDPLDPGSYRPISLTSCLCKLLERILNKRLVWCLEKQGVIDRTQSGFRKGRSTLDSLVALENKIHQAFLTNRLLVSVFVDLEKAYDTCWSLLVLQELYKAGLRGNLPVLIREFMRNRKFQVRVGKNLSEVKKLEMGVPQGSILSVTLFLLAINTVIRYLPACVDRSVYVDDLRFSVLASNLQTAQRLLNGALVQLGKWMRSTGFRISETKTKVVVFHRRPVSEKSRNHVLDFTLDLRLEGRLLEVVREIKFLGLIFDQRLTWNAQLGELRRKCLKALGALKVMSKYNRRTDRDVYIRIYKAMVLSKLDYGCQVYGTASDAALKRLDPIHHAALRISTGAFRTSNVQSLYVEAFVPSLWDRRIFLNLCYMFRSRRIPMANRINDWEDDQWDERYRRLISRPNSYGFLVRKAVVDLELGEPMVAPFRLYNFAPWKLSKLSICFALAQYGKGETSEEVFRQLFGNHRHTGDVEVFTDGSKMGDKVGAGVVIIGGGLDSEFGERLGDQASVFTAELVAIRVALTKLRSKRNLQISFYSDSRSALQALMAYNSDNVLVQDIQELVNELLKNSVHVTFCWVPSHVGIMGNEEADRMAKMALGKIRHGQETVFYSDLRSHIRERVYHNWRDRWKNMQEHGRTQLREVQDFVRPRKWGAGLSRIEDVKMTRIRIGHTRFARDYYFTDGEPPECIECGEFLTVKHVLLECGNFYHERREFLGTQQLDLSTLLGSSDVVLKRVLEFFREIGLYQQI